MNIAREFDRVENLIYLNSANLSLCPRTVIEGMDRYHREFERNPTQGLVEAWDHLWNSQKRVASFLGSDPADLFLRTNITSSLNTFILGMPLPPGSEILVGELEYGAIVNICRLRAERENLSWRILKMPQTPLSFQRLTSERLRDEIVSQLGPKTSLLLLSHVIAGTGLVLPIEAIARETRARGILFAVDGAYAPGALPFNLESLGDIDFYGCSLYKWMMGPKGTAFGWIPKRHQERIQPLNAGWTTYDFSGDISGPISGYGEGSVFQRRMLLSGCHDFAPFRALKELFDFWDYHRPKAIQERMLKLRHHLAEEFERQLGWVLLQPQEERLRGPMLVYVLPDRLQTEGPKLARRLLDEKLIQVHGIHLADRWHLGFSPHVYNSEEEISRATELLAQL